MGKFVVASIVATLACGSASAYLWNELRAEREQTQTLQARVAELERAHAPAPAEQAAQQQFPPPLPERAPPGEPQATVKRPPEARLGASFTAVNATGAPAAALSMRGGQMDPEMRRRMQQSMDQQRRLLQDPEYRELMRQQQIDGMQHMYGDLELMLGLSHEEAARVLDVLADQQLRSMEQQRPWAMDGSRPDEAAIREQQRVFAEMKRKNDAELAQVLGSKYSEWESYQQSMGARSQVTQLRQALATSDEPLRQDQIKPLVAAIAREQQAQMNATRARTFPGRFGDPEAQLRMQEEWAQQHVESQQRIRNSVSSLLTPAQMQRLEEQHERERRSLEMQVRMQRARMKEAEARGEDPNANGMAIAAPVAGSQIGFVAGP
jgi:hypothetical protein